MTLPLTPDPFPFQYSSKPLMTIVSEKLQSTKWMRKNWIQSIRRLIINTITNPTVCQTLAWSLTTEFPTKVSSAASSFSLLNCSHGTALLSATTCSYEDCLWKKIWARFADFANDGAAVVMGWKEAHSWVKTSTKLNVIHFIIHVLEPFDHHPL